MSETARIPGGEAVAGKGIWRAHKWLVARRASQALVLGLFLAGPLAGAWIVKGSLTASLTLDVLPLTDPFVTLQSLVAGHLPETTALTGAAVLVGFYLLVGGRVFCSWVCPINPITDAARWLRLRLGHRGGRGIPRQTRLWVLGAALVVSAATGGVAWELVNPVSIVFREMVFGVGMGWLVALALFLFDLLVVPGGWCGRLCPVGAVYGLIGEAAATRVSARGRERCDDCLDCYAVCPEPHVIVPGLKGAAKGGGPVIRSGDCTNCGRCIDVCPRDVFVFTTRFDRRTDPGDPARHSAMREAA